MKLWRDDTQTFVKASRNTSLTMPLKPLCLTSKYLDQWTFSQFFDIFIKPS
jgi:hypothetical protein